MALKRSSELITISGTHSNTTDGFAVDPTDLQLNPLDQEVFVVQAVKIDWTEPVPEPLGSLPAGTFWRVNQPICFTTTRPASLPTLGDSNCFATARRTAVAQIIAGNDISTYTLVEQNNTEMPDAEIPYLAIIATSDFFVSSLDDSQNLNNVNVAFKIYGYRAKADSATYAALVQSEVLSS